jgi:hypothetical protein
MAIQNFDICNLALAKLGDEAVITGINPSDGSIQSTLCGRLYDHVLALMLDKHAWSFGIKEVALLTITNTSPSWLYAYTIPTDCLSVVDVREGVYNDQLQAPNSQNYSLQGGLLYSNTPDAWLLYSSSTPPAIAAMPPMFIEAFACLLAANLAGPIIRGDVGAAAAQTLYKTFAVALQMAIESDCTQRRVTPTFLPSGIAARA